MSTASDVPTSHSRKLAPDGIRDPAIEHGSPLKEYDSNIIRKVSHLSINRIFVWLCSIYYYKDLNGEIALELAYLERGDQNGNAGQIIEEEIGVF